MSDCVQRPRISSQYVKVVCTLDDISGLVHLANAVNWDYDERDIQHVLSVGAVYAYRDTKGDMIASAALIPYEEKYAFIGMVIVHPDYQGKGLGRGVMNDCIEQLAGRDALLIATPECEMLYERLGFSSVGVIDKCLSNMYKPFPFSIHGEAQIVAYQSYMLPTIIELDEQAFGDIRTEFLSMLIDQAERVVVLRNEHGIISGYALLSKGPVYDRVGPVVAPAGPEACLLIDTLMRDTQRKLRIDLSAGDPEVLTFLQERGFECVHSAPMMRLYGMSMPERNGQMYAISTQAFG